MTLNGWCVVKQLNNYNIQDSKIVNARKIMFLLFFPFKRYWFLAAYLFLNVYACSIFRTTYNKVEGWTGLDPIENGHRQFYRLAAILENICFHTTMGNLASILSKLSNILHYSS